MQIARMIRDCKYCGVTHKKGTGWAIDGKEIFVRKNKVMILAGHGEYMELEIGKDVVMEEKLDVCPHCKRAL